MVRNVARGAAVLALAGALLMAVAPARTTEPTAAQAFEMQLTQALNTPQNRAVLPEEVLAVEWVAKPPASMPFIPTAGRVGGSEVKVTFRDRNQRHVVVYHPELVAQQPLMLQMALQHFRIERVGKGDNSRFAFRSTGDAIALPTSDAVEQMMSFLTKALTVAITKRLFDEDRRHRSTFSMV